MQYPFFCHPSVIFQCMSHLSGFRGGAKRRFKLLLLLLVQLGKPLRPQRGASQSLTEDGVHRGRLKSARNTCQVWKQESKMLAAEPWTTGWLILKQHSEFPTQLYLYFGWAQSSGVSTTTSYSQVVTSATDKISCLASGWQTYSTFVERGWFCFSTQGVPFPISNE